MTIKEIKQAEKELVIALSEQDLERCDTKLSDWASRWGSRLILTVLGAKQIE